MIKRQSLTNTNTCGGSPEELDQAFGLSTHGHFFDDKTGIALYSPMLNDRPTPPPPETQQQLDQQISCINGFSLMHQTLPQVAISKAVDQSAPAASNHFQGQSLNDLLFCEEDLLENDQVVQPAGNQQQILAKFGQNPTYPYKELQSAAQDATQAQSASNTLDMPQEDSSSYYEPKRLMKDNSSEYMMMSYESASFSLLSNSKNQNMLQVQQQHQSKPFNEQPGPNSSDHETYQKSSPQQQRQQQQKQMEDLQNHQEQQPVLTFDQAQCHSQIEQLLATPSVRQGGAIIKQQQNQRQQMCTNNTRFQTLNHIQKENQNSFGGLSGLNEGDSTDLMELLVANERLDDSDKKIQSTAIRLPNGGLGLSARGNHLHAGTKLQLQHSEPLNQQAAALGGQNYVQNNMATDQWNGIFYQKNCLTTTNGQDAITIDNNNKSSTDKENKNASMGVAEYQGASRQIMNNFNQNSINDKESAFNQSANVPYESKSKRSVTGTYQQVNMTQATNQSQAYHNNPNQQQDCQFYTSTLPTTRHNQNQHHLQTNQNLLNMQQFANRQLSTPEDEDAAENITEEDDYQGCLTLGQMLHDQGSLVDVLGSSSEGSLASRNTNMGNPVLGQKSQRSSHNTTMNSQSYQQLSGQNLQNAQNNSSQSAKNGDVPDQTCSGQQNNQSCDNINGLNQDHAMYHIIEDSKGEGEQIFNQDQQQQQYKQELQRCQASFQNLVISDAQQCPQENNYCQEEIQQTDCLLGYQCKSQSLLISAAAAASDDNENMYEQYDLAYEQEKQKQIMYQLHLQQQDPHYHLNQKQAQLIAILHGLQNKNQPAIQDFFNRQVNLETHMRQTLISWVQEVCAKVRFSRLTFHYAVYFIDKFFELSPSLIPVSEFQTIGITAVAIAAKMEEIYVPDNAYFCSATGQNNVSVKMLCQMERRMLNLLQFKLLPVTLMHWADYMSQAWDNFADMQNTHQFCEHQDISMRKFSYYSYRRLRIFYAVIDCVGMDFQGRGYEMRDLCLASLFFTIGSQHGVQVFPNDYEIAVNYTQYAPVPRNSGGIALSPQEEFYCDGIFDIFVKTMFADFQLTELEPALIYVARFFAMTMNLDPLESSDALANSTDPERVIVEEYLQQQTYYEEMGQYLQWVAQKADQTDEESSQSPDKL